MNKELLNKLNLLYVEDEDEIREMISKVLKKLCNSFEVASDGVEGLEKFKNRFFNKNIDDFDIVLTDISMPKMNGLDMLKEIRDLDHMVPMVITTAHTDSSFLRESIELGVRGYAVKPTSLEHLLNSIEIAVESRVLEKELEYRVEIRTQELNNVIKELEKKTTELEYLVIHDDLTQLFNRKKFNDELSKEYNRKKRYNNNVSLLMLDLDYFKSINDNCGHQFGDEVLIKVANIFQKEIRNIDILCRWGGEEFMILLPETDLKNASLVANKIRKSIENFGLKCGQHNITVSIGVTTIFKTDTIDNILTRVDELLYKAKENGRNRVEISLDI